VFFIFQFIVITLMSDYSFFSDALCRAYPIYYREFYTPKRDQMVLEVNEFQSFMLFVSRRKNHFIIGDDLVKIVFKYWNPLEIGIEELRKFVNYHPIAYIHHHSQLRCILPTLSDYPTALQKFQFLNTMIHYRKVSDKSFLLATWYVQKRKEHWFKENEEFATYCDVLEEYIFDENSDTEMCDEEEEDWSDLLEGVKHEIILNSEE